MDRHDATADVSTGEGSLLRVAGGTIDWVDGEISGTVAGVATRRCVVNHRPLSEVALMADDHAIYREIPGGAELLQWFGEVPGFHDAEILGLDLRRNGQSELKIHGWIMTNEIAENGSIALDRCAIVIFRFDDVVDLQIEGFNHQNVIYGLILRRALHRPERRDHLSLPPLPQDFEIELLPCYGLSGFIRARTLSITVQPGKPQG